MASFHFHYNLVYQHFFKTVSIVTRWFCDIIEDNKTILIFGLYFKKTNTKMIKGDYQNEKTIQKTMVYWRSYYRYNASCIFA